MKGIPQTIKICFTRKETDAYSEDEQLFFNITREDVRYRWFAVAAREPTRNSSPICRHNPNLLKVMTDLIAISLDKIDLIFPEFKRAAR